MENSKRNWKLSEKAKNPRSQWEIAAGKLKTFWKQQKLFCFFSKNRLLPCRIPKSGRNSGHQGGKTARKWLDYTVKPCLKIGWRNRQFSAIQQKRLWHLFYHSLMSECDKKDTLLFHNCVVWFLLGVFSLQLWKNVAIIESYFWSKIFFHEFIYQRRRVLTTTPCWKGRDGLACQNHRLSRSWRRISNNFPGW